MKREFEKPTENHFTAAWSNIERKNRISKTAHPSLDQVLEAKEYVDENEK